MSGAPRLKAPRLKELPTPLHPRWTFEKIGRRALGDGDGFRGLHEGVFNEQCSVSVPIHVMLGSIPGDVIGGSSVEVLPSVKNASANSSQRASKKRACSFVRPSGCSLPRSLARAEPSPKGERRPFSRLHPRQKGGLPRQAEGRQVRFRQPGAHDVQAYPESPQGQEGAAIVLVFYGSRTAVFMLF